MSQAVLKVLERDSVKILGIPVDRVTMDQAVAKVCDLIESGGTHLVVTADSSGIAQAQSDPEYFDLIQKASLVTPDSYGVVWAARRNGKPVPERVSGVDLVDRLCALSSDKGYRIFLLGAEPGLAEVAAEKLRLKHPGCNIVGSRHGYFPAESDEVIAQEVAPLKPDILLVGMGIPRQEKFIAKTMSVIGAKVGIGVGGSIDVFSGKAKRAPAIIQRLRMEWLWRLILNPKKWGKAKTLPKFAWMVLRSKAGQ